MEDRVEVYDLDGNSLGLQDRKKFYLEIKKEFNKSGKISKKIKAIRLLLMNSKGRVYLQKRSKLKEENPYLFDKTIGGHVNKDETYDITTIRECAEELGFPVAIVSGQEFNKAIIATNISIVGIIKKVDFIPNFQSIRISKKGGKFIQPFMTSIYIGYYDGAIRFIDGESSGIEVFSLEELKSEIQRNPDKFTEDLKFMIKKYRKYLKPIKT